jgi:polar amino acid transport system substrate-binding protein
MMQMARMLTLGLGIAIVSQSLYAQQGSDPRIADFVKAGRVRVGFGMNPTLAIRDPSTGQLRGPALEIAQALAKRMGVELAPVEYPSPGAVLQGIESKAWDLTFLVIDPGRAATVDFSSPYMQSDFTYLVSNNSSMRGLTEVDRPGIRIAVVRNDASDLRLTRSLKQAELVRADDINAAVEFVRAGQAHAAAAPRPVLLAQAAKVGGTRVLDDGFAAISYAAVVPKGNAQWLAYVDEFIEEAKASGLVKQTIESAGLRGVQVAPGRNPGTR